MSRPVQERDLRWRWEAPITALSILLNLVLLLAAFAIVFYGTEGLESRPVLAKRADQFRILGIGGILAPPLITVARNARRGRVRGDSVRISPSQIPEIHRLLEEQCRVLQLTRMPELYLTRVEKESRAFSSYERDYIVLSTADLGPLEESLDVLAFLLGRQLGAIRLGHTAWWRDLFLWYVTRIPGVRSPIRKAWAYSEDAYGAYLAPRGVQALLVLAVGRFMSREVDLAGYLRQVREYGGFWDRLACMGGESTPIARRLLALHEAGLLPWEEETSRSAIPEKPAGATGSSVRPLSS